jgi:hypothetical protein
MPLSFEELAKKLAEDRIKIENTAKKAIKDLFKSVKDLDSNIISIEYSGTPNSYCDEGMYCEGRVIVIFPDNQSETFDSEYGPEPNVEGVWSADDDTRVYNRETKKWEDKGVESLHKYTAFAKELFEQVEILKPCLGTDHFEIRG